MEECTARWTTKSRDGGFSAGGKLAPQRCALLTLGAVGDNLGPFLSGADQLMTECEALCYPVGQPGRVTSISSALLKRLK